MPMKNLFQVSSKKSRSNTKPVWRIVHMLTIHSQLENHKQNLSPNLKFQKCNTIGVNRVEHNTMTHGANATSINHNHSHTLYTKAIHEGEDHKISEYYYTQYRCKKHLINTNTCHEIQTTISKTILK